MFDRLRRIAGMLRRRPVVSLALAGLAVFLLLWLGKVIWLARARAAAEAALAAFDFQSADEHLETCLWLSAADPELRLLAVQSARRDGKLDLAERHLRAYHDLLGETTFAERLEQAMIDTQRGDIASSVRFLGAQVDAKHPLSVEILESFARGSVQVYQLQSARFWIEELLTRSPNNPVGRLLRAQTIDTYGHPRQAVKELQSVLEEYPRYAAAREALAGALYSVHEYQEAKENYELLRAQRPGAVNPLLGLVRCYGKLGTPEKAGPLLMELEKDHGDHHKAMYECGRGALREKRFADAERFFQRSLELSPFDRDAHLGLALCLDQLGKPEESQAHARRAREIEMDASRLEKALGATLKDPRDPAPRVVAGRVCLRNGQPGEALRWLKGALEIDGGYNDAHAALADLYQSLGNAADAAYHRRKASMPPRTSKTKGLKNRD